MIKIYNVTKSYDQADVETIALNKIDLEIKRGEFVAVMGPSGCGKTTLLNVLGMLDGVSNGQYIFDDIPVTRLNDKERTLLRKGKVGFVFQSFNLIDELNVYQNVELPLRYMDIKSSERKSKVAQLLKAMNISHRAKYYPYQLSGGQQQLVAIARAVITSPELILADEPTGNLDSATGAEIMDILTDLNSTGTTIVMATHSKRDAGYAHRIINLYDGSIVASINNM